MWGVILNNADKNDLIIASLRHREGIPESGLCRVLGSEMELGILINRFWKVDRGQEINDLEFRVTEESGELVNEFAHEIYVEKGFYGSEKVPFPACDVTISTLIGLVTAGAKKLNRPKYTEYAMRLVKELRVGEK